MKCNVEINSINTIYDIEGYWSDEDYIALLDAMNFPDAEGSDPQELKDLLFMAISDFEPNEAAEIVLNHKLGSKLQKGQIQNMSHEMMEDSVSEEYSDISLHFDLFNINRLLHVAYNGTFPNTKASRLELILTFKPPLQEPLSKEIVLKALSEGLSSSNLVNRLFDDQLKGKLPFTEAEAILWQMDSKEDGKVTIITSDYWINKEDLEGNEFESTIHLYEPDED